MDRREHDLGPRRLDGDATLFHHAEARAEDRLRGDRAKAEDDVGPDDRDLVLEPWEARAHLAGAWRLVQTAFAARVARPFEVLDRVGDVDVLAVDARGFERAIEQLAGRSDERASGGVLDVSGLLADDHESRAAGALAEHRLGRVLDTSRSRGIRSPLREASSASRAAG